MGIKKVGILASVKEEIDIFKELIKGDVWDGIEVCFNHGGVGKVSAALVTQEMIYEEDPDILIYVGAAGSISADVNMNDIVIVTRAIDAELDVRGYSPTLKKGEDPFTHIRIYKPDQILSMIALDSPLGFRIIEGFAATTSVFMDKDQKEAFVEQNLADLSIEEEEGHVLLPNIVDMESCAFFNVCIRHGKPCLVIKTVANSADSDASEEYESFRKNSIKNYLSVVAYVLNTLKKQNLVAESHSESI